MAFVLFVLIFGGFLTVLPVHLKDEFGVAAGLRGLVLAVPAVTSTLTALNLGRLRARFGAGPLLVTGSLLLAAGLVILRLAPSLPILLLAPVVYGFVGVTRLGQTVGPVAAGVGLAHFDSAPIFLAGALFAGLLALAYPFVRRWGDQQEIAPLAANPVP